MPADANIHFLSLSRLLLLLLPAGRQQHPAVVVSDRSYATLSLLSRFGWLHHTQKPRWGRHWLSLSRHESPRDARYSLRTFTASRPFYILCVYVFFFQCVCVWRWKIFFFVWLGGTGSLNWIFAVDFCTPGLRYSDVRLLSFYIWALLM